MYRLFNQKLVILSNLMSVKMTSQDVNNRDREDKGKSHFMKYHIISVTKNPQNASTQSELQ